MRLLKDRSEAGKLLARDLKSYAKEPDLIVMGLPRGGIPVAFEVAMALEAPLDVFLVRKLGVPGREELAMGAVASGGVRILNHSVIANYSITRSMIEVIAGRAVAELSRRERVYRKNLGPQNVANKTVILVDDGIATGATMLAALKALKMQNPAKLIVAVPVASEAIDELLSRDADEVVCLMKPEIFYGVGEWYIDFSQTSDAEVVELLQKAWERILKPIPQTDRPNSREGPTPMHDL